MKTISMHRLLHSFFFVAFGVYICVDSIWIQYSTPILYTALLIGICSVLFSPGHKVRIDGFVLLFLAFAGYVCLSTFWSVAGNAFIGAARIVLKYSIATVVLYWNIKSVEDINKLLSILWIAGIVMALYSIKFYGLNYMLTAISHGIRLGGEIIQINGFGYTTAIALCLSYTNMFYNRRRVGKFLNILAMPPLFLCVLSSGSRRSFIAVLAFIIFFTFYQKGIGKKYWKIVFVAFALIVIGNILINAGILDSLFVRFSELENYTKSGNTDYEGDLYRVKLIQLGAQYFIQNPLFGSGANAFRTLNISYFGTSIASHNNVIEILVNYGIIGAVLYYGNWIRALKVSFRYRKRSQEAMILFVMMISLILLAEMTTITHIDSMTEYIIMTAGSSLFFVVGAKDEKIKIGRCNDNKKISSLD
jgi:O-antigen ligase